MKAYPVYFKQTKNGFIAFNSLIPIATQGKNLEECILMAKDAIELMAYDYYIENDYFRKPEECLDEDAEEYDFISYVLCDLERYRRLEEDKKVKKNCTIPETLAKKAEKKGLNFSKILTYALEKELDY